MGRGEKAEAGRSLRVPWECSAPQSCEHFICLSLTQLHESSSLLLGCLAVTFPDTCLRMAAMCSEGARQAEEHSLPGAGAC